MKKTTKADITSLEYKGRVLQAVDRMLQNAFKLEADWKARLYNRRLIIARDLYIQNPQDRNIGDDASRAIIFCWGDLVSMRKKLDTIKRQLEGTNEGGGAQLAARNMGYLVNELTSSRSFFAEVASILSKNSMPQAGLAASTLGKVDALIAMARGVAGVLTRMAEAKSAPTKASPNHVAINGFLTRARALMSRIPKGEMSVINVNGMQYNLGRDMREVASRTERGISTLENALMFEGKGWMDRVNAALADAGNEFGYAARRYLGNYRGIADIERLERDYEKLWQDIRSFNINLRGSAAGKAAPMNNDTVASVTTEAAKAPSSGTLRQIGALEADVKDDALHALNIVRAQKLNAPRSMAYFIQEVETNLNSVVEMIDGLASALQRSAADPSALTNVAISNSNRIVTRLSRAVSQTKDATFARVIVSTVTNYLESAIAKQGNIVRMLGRLSTAKSARPASLDNWPLKHNRPADLMTPPSAAKKAVVARPKGLPERKAVSPGTLRQIANLWDRPIQMMRVAQNLLQSLPGVESSVYSTLETRIHAMEYAQRLLNEGDIRRVAHSPSISMYATLDTKKVQGDPNMGNPRRAQATEAVRGAYALIDKIENMIAQLDRSS